MLILTGKDIHSVFSMRDAIEADKKAFVLHSQGCAKVPLRINLETDAKDGQCMFMPAYVGGSLNMAGVKIVSYFPANASKGIPVVPATVPLIDGTTGLVTAIMEGTVFGSGNGTSFKRRQLCGGTVWNRRSGIGSAGSSYDGSFF